MATNADGAQGDDDTARVTEEDLRRDKYGADGVDTSQDEDETDSNDETDDDESDDTGEDDAQSDDDAQDDNSEDDSNDDSDDEDSDTFVKEFDNIKGDTLSDYTRNLEQAYTNSTAEALRLKRENDELKAKDTASDSGSDSGQADDTGDKKSDTPTSMSDLYVKQQMDKEIVEAYTEFAKDFNQVDDPAEYKKFTQTVAQLAKTIMDGEKRIAAPRELYSKAAVILDWQPIEKKPSDKERTGMALKDRAAVSKGQSGPKKPASKSKVSQKMIELNRKMYPGKTDSEIRAELEPHVQS